MHLWCITIDETAKQNQQKNYRPKSDLLINQGESSSHSKLTHTEQSSQQKFHDQMREASKNEKLEAEIEEMKKRFELISEETEKKHRDEIEKLDKSYSEKRRNYRKSIEKLKEEKVEMCQEHKDNINNLMETLDRANDSGNDA